MNCGHAMFGGELATRLPHANVGTMCAVLPSHHGRSSPLRTSNAQYDGSRLNAFGKMYGRLPIPLLSRLDFGETARAPWPPQNVGEPPGTEQPDCAWLL